ncbi:c-type cytochrome [Alcaligenes endophyticus]|uniref:C-type cytochrome n=1 Tax=Alcaligenes endophyticus TaxID=1929088 RepID=A0ABT8EJM7_9BURK|nr:c-type cytochrome [Alcaligenes endophyticus]MCX5591799.1 c-type cytochrome [Alcaligenes endophyticus]MDN4121476.1 c-type cytochrome [Alcaligenes endophyticus]
MQKPSSSRPAPSKKWWLLSALLVCASGSADELTDQGKTIATSGSGAVLACVTCHGAQGEGNAAAGFPFLAGQGTSYLTEQLTHFHDGKRQNPIMEPIAKAMSADQMKAVAAYYSQLSPPWDKQKLSNVQDLYPAQSQLGAWIANRGDWDNNIPACIQCHGPGGVGVGTSFPAIAGLSAAYITAQFKAWQTNSRDPGPQSIMGDIAKRMNEQQIQATADYFAALPTELSKAATQGAK